MRRAGQVEGYRGGGGGGGYMPAHDANLMQALGDTTRTVKMLKLLSMFDRAHIHGKVPHYSLEFLYGLALPKSPINVSQPSQLCMGGM